MAEGEGEGSDLSLSKKVDEMMAMLQTMSMETAGMKNTLTDTLNKNNNNKENDDDDEVSSHRGTMTQYKLLLSRIISFCKIPKTALPLFRSQQEAATMRSESISCPQEERRNLSEEVDELRTEFQTLRSEVAEMKNMLSDALNKINKENNNDDEEVSHRGTSPPQFSFSSAAAAATTIMQQQPPSFERRTDGGPPFTFGSASSVNNDQMQQQQQRPQPFNAGWSFSLGTGGGDKFGRKFVKVQRKQRKK